MRGNPSFSSPSSTSSSCPSPSSSSRPLLPSPLCPSSSPSSSSSLPPPPSSSASSFYSIFAFAFFIVFLLSCDIVTALKCKCTQNSPKVPCEHGVCEVPSVNSACLMLDHPQSGRHYACSTSDLREGECVEKQSKSGANVKVCSCNSSDFCNFKIWPDGKESPPFEDGDDEGKSGGDESEEEEGEGEQTNSRRRGTEGEEGTKSNRGTKQRKDSLFFLTTLPVIIVLSVLSSNVFFDHQIAV